MERQFLSHLRNRIGWKSWYKAASAALAAAVFAFGFPSFFAIAFSAALYAAAFFWRRRGHGEILAVSYWAFTAFLSLGSYVIGKETDFFEYFGGLQAASLLIAYFMFVGIFSALPAGKRVSVSEAAVHTVLFLFWTMLSSFLIDRWGPVWFLPYFAVVALVAHEIIARSLSSQGPRERAYALVAGLVSAELLAALRFLPFHLIPQAIAVTVALIVFFDAIRAHEEGRLSRAFVVEKAATFGFFAVLLGFFSKWAL